MIFNKVAIVGLGLIGGSLARAFKNNGVCKTLIAVDKDKENIDLALREGAIEEGYQEITENIFDSDSIFICTPVLECMRILELLEGKVEEDCIITDVSSTKTQVVEFVENMKGIPQFIGGHPMAGKERSGFVASDEDLYKNATYILTPTSKTTKKSMELMKRVVKKIGANPIIVDVDEHDKLLAGVSHIPHIVASAIVNLLSHTGYDKDKYKRLIGGGFIDTTRIASSNPTMWEHILVSNSKNIVEQLDIFQNIIKEIRDNVDKLDSEKIYGFFNKAKEYRDGVLRSEK